MDIYSNISVSKRSHFHAFFFKMIEEGNYGIQDYSIWILRDAEHIVWQKSHQIWPRECIFMMKILIQAAILKKGQKMAAILKFRVARVLFVIFSPK